MRKFTLKRANEHFFRGASCYKHNLADYGSDTNRARGLNAIKRNHTVQIDGKNIMGYYNIKGLATEGKLLIKQGRDNKKKRLEFVVFDNEKELRSEVYILNQLLESAKRGYGYIYIPPLCRSGFYEFKNDLESFRKTYSNEIIVEAIQIDKETRDLFLKTCNFIPGKYKSLSEVFFGSATLHTLRMLFVGDSLGY